MKIDELIEELEQIREEHGNLVVGVNYEMCAYRDISGTMVKSRHGGPEKAWIKDKGF